MNVYGISGWGHYAGALAIVTHESESEALEFLKSKDKSYDWIGEITQIGWLLPAADVPNWDIVYRWEE